jgi:DNA-binding PadR family transcriptional regulator
VSNLLGKAPQGAPRGLLIYWMLHRIARSPTYGYEILTEIEQKTEGAWRPGPGSIYPLLKKLASKGYVQVEPSKTGRSAQMKYKITPKGAERVRESREMSKRINSRFMQMRSIFVDLIGPDELAGYVVDGARRQFELAKDVVESNRGKIPEPELVYMLREYSLLLERQQEWASKLLRTSVPVTKASQRRRIP